MKSFYLYYEDGRKIRAVGDDIGHALSPDNGFHEDPMHGMVMYSEGEDTHVWWKDSKAWVLKADLEANCQKPTPPPGRIGYEHEMPKPTSSPESTHVESLIRSLLIYAIFSNEKTKNMKASEIREAMGVFFDDELIKNAIISMGDK